jgi:lysophospholipase L1-like esterase
MLRNLSLLGVALLAMGLLLEAAARLVWPVPPTWIQPQTYHLHSPLLGWVLPPGLQAYTIDAPVRINSLGLRDDEFPVEKPAGEHRILCLGDSFSFALGVRFEDVYAQQLETLLSKQHPGARFQVINAGVAGYNTRQELIQLLAQGFSFSPDLISVGFYWNDLLSEEEPLPDLAKTPMYDPDTPGQDSGLHHTLPSWLRDRLRASVLLYQIVIRSKMLLQSLDPPQDDTSRVQKALLEGDTKFLEPFWRITGQRLLEVAAAAREHGVPVVLLAFPMENQIKLDFPRMVWGERLREIWAPTGMPFIDLDPSYRAALKAGHNPFLPYDLHPNALGMRIAAEQLFEVITQRNLLALHAADAAKAKGDDPRLEAVAQP